MEKEIRIAAGIVLYRPDMDRLKQCLEHLSGQTGHIYIFDNSPDKICLEQTGHMTCLSEPGNKGIAYALNRIMERAVLDGYRWVLTMDQDSVIPDGMVEDFMHYIQCGEALGIVCPQVIDRRRAYMLEADRDKIQYIDMCITSASCTSVDAWEAVGRYDESLFIDLVDNEFCKRLTASGYKILQVNKWILDQEFGNITPKSERVQKFWIKWSKLLHNENIAKFSYRKVVYPERVYYTNRNIIYVNRKLKNYGKTAYENYNCKGYLGFLISFNLPSLLRAQHRGKVLGAMFRGMRDGCRKKVQPWAAGQRTDR